jgi:two-component system response regulator QseB
MHVLLVEDDPLVASGIVSGLRLHAITVDHADTAATAVSTLDAGYHDLVVLDLGLPDEDGLSLLRRWRQAGRAVPILVLTARDALEDRLAGLRSGADDYVLKPFDLDELVARLQALQRRAAGRSVDVVRHGPLCFDPSSQRVTLHGVVVELSRRELALLQALLDHPNRILTIDQIRYRRYGMDDMVESNALSVHIHHLRRKLGTGVVQTVRGVGYRLGKAGT